MSEPGSSAWTDQHGPDTWIERAVAQTQALRQTIERDPDLRDLVDVILLDLAARITDRALSQEYAS